jgi:hypothetical protein
MSKSVFGSGVTAVLVMPFKWKLVMLALPLLVVLVDSEKVPGVAS